MHIRVAEKMLNFSGVEILVPVQKKIVILNDSAFQL